MNMTKAIMILTLLLTMKAKVGQSNPKCNCFHDANLMPASCGTRGCSNVNNRYCSDGTYNSGPFNVATHSTFDYFLDDKESEGAHYCFACNCPGTSSTAVHNSYYGALNGAGGYGPFIPIDHTTCTDFAAKARNAQGNIPPYTHEAVDCCNFCCGRDDPYPVTATTTIATTAPSTSKGNETVFNIWLYLSGLILLSPFI